MDSIRLGIIGLGNMGTGHAFNIMQGLIPGITLAAIAGDHVVLDRAGTREALWIDSGGEAPVQRFDPGQAPSNLPPPAAGPGLTPENAPPSVMPDEEEEKPPVSAARAPAQEPQQ